MGVDKLEKDRGENIGRYISHIYRKGGTFITKSLAKEGIGSGQVMFLIELYKKDGRTQDDISHALNIDKGTTARALKKLEEENFIVRLKDEHDKRAHNVYLTDKGKEVKPIVYKVFDELENTMTQNLTDEEKETIVMLLKKVCMNTSVK
jgi:DNA-binding MarR family transcriptional regulator